MHLERNDAIARIRTALKRSGKTWSVTGGTGTAWGWIDVQAPPARRNELGYTSAPECAEIAKLFGLSEPVHCQGLSISPDERGALVARLEGTRP